ncbi:MAG: acetolactate synthase, large subunit, biosynthetic type [Clostridiales bacterium]|nr:acetolactate synthase, large subunit, biosynthetic type [Clostridiales bacterium]
MKMKGARVLVECLKEQGVDTIFGYPGGTVLNIYDELYDEKALKHILTVHEQGATHAADGYARATGKVGVVLVTSGPGASNTVTGIATAFRDSIPLVIMTGQVSRHLIGKDSFQEINITEITKGITKDNFLVMEPESLPDIVREAFRIARSGRPGPVLIDIPKDVQQFDMEYTPISIEDNTNSPESNPYSDDDIEKALKYINESKCPVIYAGGGVISSGSHAELKTLAERINAPVSCSLMGLGSFPGDHPLFMGMEGMHGSFCSNYAFSHGDLIIGLGTRFNDRVTCKTDEFAPRAKIIDINIDPEEFDKNINPDLSLCGDLKSILERLLKGVKPKEYSTWNKNVENWKNNLDCESPYNGSLSPEYLLKKLKELTDGKAIICTEVGQNQMWTARYYSFNEPRTFISSGGLGTMGFGLGAAIGSAIGRPDKQVINIAGDGSFKMNMQELATISKYQIPLIQIVLNNSSLGMVKQWQKLFFNNRISETDVTPDVEFTTLAAAFGIFSMKLTRNEDVEEVLSKALSMKKPVLIECIIHEDNMATPMVPLGSGLSNCKHVG